MSNSLKSDVTVFSIEKRETGKMVFGFVYGINISAFIISPFVIVNVRVQPLYASVP